MPKFLLGQQYLNLRSAIDLFLTLKTDGSAGGSAQIYFGQRFLSLKSVFDFFQTIKMERSAGGSAQIPFRAAILKPQIGI